VIEELRRKRIFDSYAFNNLPLVQVFTHKSSRPALRPSHKHKSACWYRETPYRSCSLSLGAEPRPTRACSH